MQTLLRFERVTKSYGARLVISELHGEINTGNIIGLVGDNGTGKSTLLRILAGLEQPDSGRFQSFAREARVGYLPQEIAYDDGTPIREYVRQGMLRLVKIEQEMRQLEQSMAAGEGDLEDTLNRYGQLTQEFERLDGYSLDAKVEMALNDVGLDPVHWDRATGTLSGGQKTRMALARVVLAQPDILLMDEPTNYLDIEGLAWLEAWVKRYPGAVVIVSHDRYFLDQVATHMWEIDRHEIRHYTGNYSDYRRQREDELKQQWEQYERDQVEKKRLRELIAKQMQWFSAAHDAAGQDDFQRARAKKMASRAKAVMSRLDRKLQESVEKPWEKDELGIDFKAPDHASQKLVSAERLSFSYTDVPLLQEVSFQLRPGERVAIVGENGAGKTTFLRLLMGELQASSGRMQDSPSLSIGYFSQEREDLALENTLLDEMLKIKGLSRSDAWLILARLGFRGQDVHRQLKVLSVGQRARVSLAKLLVSPHNVLVLDEPTNHLDIRSREKIEEALNEYLGAMILVSHDRYFLDLAVNQVYHLNEKTLTRHLGNYSYFVAQQNRDLVAEERQRQEMMARARMAELAARLSTLNPEQDEYAELDRGYKEAVERLRKVRSEGSPNG